MYSEYYLYILYSPSIDRFYIGSSHNPHLRLQYHNSSPKGWTHRGRPWQLVFTKPFKTKSAAQKWEQWIKCQKQRRVIETIIDKTFDWNIIL